MDRLQDLAIALHTTPGKMLDVIVETNETTITDGLSAESIAKLKSYAEYLRSQGLYKDVLVGLEQTLPILGKEDQDVSK